ncbi:hypothetical protein [Paraburkholderia sp. MM5482-R1]
MRGANLRAQHVPESLAQALDLAERDVFEFGGAQIASLRAY